MDPSGPTSAPPPGDHPAAAPPPEPGAAPAGAAPAGPGGGSAPDAAVEAGAPAEPPLPRPRAAAFVVAQLALLPVGLAAQAANAVAGLVWTQLFVFVLPAAALAAAAGLSPARFLRLTPPPPRALPLALLIGGAALLVGGALQALWVSALPEGITRAFDVARLFQRPPLEQALLIAAAAGLAPVCEELGFRGHLLSALGLRRGPVAAIALSAALFAALHLDPVRLPGLLFLGALFAWLTWRSGSVYPAVLAHAVNNAAATALALGAGPAGEAPDPEPLAALAALALGLALLAGPALAFHRWLPPAPPPEAALARGPAAPGKLPRWASWSAWLAIVSLVVIALAPRR